MERRKKFKCGMIYHPVQFTADTKQKNAHKGVFCLVEPEGIEPSSEKLSLRLSPGADHLLSFPPASPMTGIGWSVSFLLMTVIKENSQFTFTADFMPDGVRGPPPCDRPHVCGGSLCSYEFAVVSV